MRTLAALLLLCGLAFGDIVHLRNGGRIEGKVTDKGDQFEVETANGKVTVEKDLVERIEKKDFTLPKGLLGKKPVKLGSTFGHPFYGFKLSLPPKWQHGKPSGQSTASFWGPKDQLYQPRMDLKYLSSKKELVDFVTAYKDAFRKSVKEVTFLSEEASAIRDKMAYQFIVSFTDGDLPVVQQALFTFIADGDRKFILSFNTSQAWYDRYGPVLDASMRSFRILPTTPIPVEDQKRFLVRYQSGEQFYKEGKLAEALADFQAASQICPDFDNLHSTLATIAMKQGRVSDAEREFKKAAELDPDDSNHHFNLGICLLKQSKSDDAILALKKAVVLEPTYEPAWTNLGAAYLGKDKNDLARETLEKAVAADPESAPAHYNLGLALERLDRKKDAEREFREAISADPKHEDAKKALDRVKSKK
jgi:tetratricopeptide (TPR) repeat protein